MTATAILLRLETVECQTAGIAQSQESGKVAYRGSPRPPSSTHKLAPREFLITRLTRQSFNPTSD
eukprot:2855870-Amphidinium_carterae.1